MNKQLNKKEMISAINSAKIITKEAPNLKRHIKIQFLINQNEFDEILDQFQITEKQLSLFTRHFLLEALKIKKEKGKNE